MTQLAAGAQQRIYIKPTDGGAPFWKDMHFGDTFAKLSLTAETTVPGELVNSTNPLVVKSNDLQVAIDWKITDANGVSYRGIYYEDEKLNQPMVMGSTLVNVEIASTDSTNYTVEIKAGADLPLETRAYVFTIVNQLGEESAPSDPLEVTFNPGREAPVFTFEASRYVRDFDAALKAGRYDLNGFRVYRTATSSTGDTEFLYAFSVGGAAIGGVDLPGDVYLAFTETFATPGDLFSDRTWTFTDIIETAALGAACPTMNNVRDIDELQSLQGLIAINNGMTASFKDNEVWISDPYTPWAFRSDGIHTIPHKVVSLVALESGFVALTDTSPFYFSGQVPEQFASQKIPGDFACTNKNAAVAIGGAVLYISPDGPVVINGMQAVIDTRTWSREAWRDEYGTRTNEIELANYGHRLVAYFPGDPAGFLFDNDDGNWTKITTQMNATMRLPSNSFIYTFDQLAYSNGDTVAPGWSIFASETTTKPFMWHSKTFRLPIPTNFGVIQLFGTGTATVDVYVDGALNYTTPTLTLDAEGTIARLPSGFRSTKWSFKINGAANSTLTGFNVATSIAELQSV